MRTVTQDAIKKLHTSLPALANEKNNWRGVWVRLSSLDEKMRKMVLNQVQGVLFLHLEDYHGHTYLCEDGDVIIMAMGVEKAVLDTVAEKLIYLLTPDWDENFVSCCTIWDFAVHWSDLIKCVTYKLSFLLTLESEKEEAQKKLKSSELLPDIDLIDHASDVAEMALRRRKSRSENVVMIVQEDICSTQSIKAELSKMLGDNCQIVTAGTGLQAYQSYAIHAPDIVFVDNRLPRVNGWSLLNKLHGLDGHACVVMLSSQNEKDSALQPLPMGAKGIINKPFPIEELMYYISQSPTYQLPHTPDSHAE